MKFTKQRSEMEIEARFITIEIDGSRHYHCIVKNQVIPEDQVLNYVGQHEEGKSNDDVICVQFRSSIVTKVPQGLKKVFPSMNVLWILSSKLKKISKEDLADYKDLTEFRCGGNELEYLSDDLFDDFQALKWIAFNDNSLKIIDPNILDKLDNLVFVDFTNNPQYGLWYSSHPYYVSNGRIEDIKQEFINQYPEWLNKLKKSERNLLKENQQLENSKLRLETELKQEKLKNIELAQKLQNGFFNDLKAFIHDEGTKDFLIQIDDHEFPVHKFLLAARSPTLAELLKNNPDVENINLVDISVDTFGDIFKFLYTDELPGNVGTNFLHLFAAAGQLKIEELKTFAASKLIDKIDEDNAVEVLTLSNKYGNEGLRQKAFDLIKNKHPDIRFNAAWASNVAKMAEVFDYIRKKEEVMRGLEAEFEELARN